MTEVLQAVHLVSLSAADWADAARVLEQSIKAGNQDAEAAYLLAMAYKRLSRTAEARQVLGKIANGDANVCLQRGILAFADRDFGQADQEFARAWEKEPASYPAGYNLLLARLCKGDKAACGELIEKIIPLAPTPDEQRFLTLLRSFVTQEAGLGPQAMPGPPAQQQASLLAAVAPAEEARLVSVLASLGPFEVVYPLLEKLVVLRPNSEAADGAFCGAALVQGRLLMERFQWSEAYALLAGVARRLEGSNTVPPPKRSDERDLPLVALYGMLGTCSCMLKDFERGAWHFRAALKAFQGEQMSGKRPERHLNSQGIYQGAWIEQNLALAYEWQNKLDKAEQHWNRYFDYLEHYVHVPPSPQRASENGAGPGDYLPRLAFEGMSRLADVFTKKEKWTAALGFLQRAHRLRPSDSDTLERLFHLYTQLKKSDEARRILRRLREVRPNDPHIDLFEMEVRELRSPEDIETTLGDMRRVLQKHPGTMHIEERAAAMINNLVPALERLGEQYTNQVNKIIEQMRRLPSYQINWPMVRNVMHDLQDKFVQLRRAAQQCLSLLTSEDLRRDLSNLITHCDRKIEQCHSLSE